MIHFGTRLFGKVDKVPKVFHVATLCGHICHLPILPAQSYLVIEDVGTNSRGVKVPFSWKSFGVAWLRVSFVVMSVTFLLLGYLCFNDRHTGVAVSLVITAVGVAVLGAWFWTYHQRGMGRATYERAMELATQVQMNDIGMVAIGEAFGKIDKAEADRLRTMLSQRPAVPPAAAPPTSPVAS